MEECGQLLTRIEAAVTAGGSRSDAATQVVEEYRTQGKRLPGIGHAIHKEGDPRAARLAEIAGECQLRGSAFASLELLHAEAEAALKRTLPVNATGAIAASLLELGVPWQLHRGFALISRTAGLLAHVGEELQSPVSPEIRKIIIGSD